MGLFRKNTTAELMDLRLDLKSILREIARYQKEPKADEKALLREFLKIKRLYHEVEKGKTKRIVMRDLIKDFKGRKISESDLRSFSVCFRRFLTVSHSLDKDLNNFSSFKEMIGNRHVMILYQMAAAANKLIDQIDKVIEEEQNIRRVA